MRPASVFQGDWLNQAVIEQYPNISAQGYGDGGSTHGSWSSNVIEWWSQEVSGTYSKFVGAHTLKYGAQWRRIGLNSFNFDNGFSFDFDQNYTSGGVSGAGDSIASMLIGAPSVTRTNRATIPGPGEFFVDYFGGFIQDDWRLNDNLILNLGLRIENESGLRERNDEFTVGFAVDDAYPAQVAAPAGLGSAPGFPLRGGLAYPGQLGFGNSQWDPPGIKIGPRAGFAYSLDDSTVVRGGFGIYWAPYAIPSGTGFGDTGALGFTQTTMHDASLGVPGGGRGSLTDPYPNGLNQPQGSAGGQTTSAGENITFNDQFKQSPYLSKWSFDYQRDLGNNLALKVGYVGSRGSQLGIGGTNNATTNINQLDPSFLGLGDSLNDPIANPFFGNEDFGAFSDDATLSRGQLLRPFPQFGNVFARHVSTGRSTYKRSASRA